jgi:hypothetical protein
MTAYFNLTPGRLRAIADDVALRYVDAVIEFHSQPAAERSADRYARLAGDVLSDAICHAADRVMRRAGVLDFHSCDRGFCDSAYDRLAEVARHKARRSMEHALNGYQGAEAQAAVMDWAKRHRAARANGDA